MGQRGRSLKWTGVMVNAILTHLDDNKGPNGLYMLDYKAALKDGVEFIMKTCPGQNVSVTQLHTKLIHLRDRNQNYRAFSRVSFYLQGRILLPPTYNREALLSPDSHDTAKIPKSQLYSLPADRHRQLRARTVGYSELIPIPEYYGR